MPTGVVPPVGKVQCRPGRSWGRPERSEESMPMARSRRRTERRWMTRSEAARYLHVSESYLASAASRGDGPPVHRSEPPARLVRYDANELDEWMTGKGGS